MRTGDERVSHRCLAHKIAGGTSSPAETATPTATQSLVVTTAQPPGTETPGQPGFGFAIEFVALLGS